MSTGPLAPPYSVDRDDFTPDEERVDRIARRLYGNERGGNLERLLQANPGLAGLALAHDGHAPRGVVLAVPLPAPAALDPAFVPPWE